MKSEATEAIDQLRKVFEELENLAKAASGAAGGVGLGQEKFFERLQAALAAAGSRLKDAEQALRRDIERGAQAADSFVHDNTWLSIGVAAAVAFVLGALTASRK